MQEADETILLGRISGLFGVRGWLKVYSYTVPPDNILKFDHWLVGMSGAVRAPMRLCKGQVQGKALVVLLAPVEGPPLADRDTAAMWVGAEIRVPRAALPDPGDAVYWADLVGCRVVTLAGVNLGRVEHLLATGANDVLVVDGERERLIPFVRGPIVTDIDLDAGVIAVDWDPDF